MKITILGCGGSFGSPLAWKRNGKIDINNKRNFRTRSSILIEINENFEEQYKKVLNIMLKNEFKVLHKKNTKDMLNNNSKFSKTYNYCNFHFSTQLSYMTDMAEAISNELILRSDDIRGQIINTIYFG